MNDDSTCRACPICATPPRKEDLIGYLEPTFSGKLTVRRYKLTYCTCNELIYIDPTPPKSDLESMYLNTQQFTSGIYTDPERVALIDSYMFASLKRILSARSIPLTHPPSVLEVGAGRAWMCRAAKRLDKACKTIAQDVSAEAAHECAWVDEYLVCDTSDKQLEVLAPFDIISLTHVIEHLPDPLGAARRCKSLLAEGGTIFVTAPHRPEGWKRGKSTVSDWQKYSYNHVPAHIQYFSRESMQKLADKSGCGLSYWEDGHENGQAFEAWLT